MTPDRKAACLLTLALVAGLSGNAATSVNATRTAAPPSVDGRVEEACWQDAAPVTRFQILNSDAPATFKTSARVLYDDTALYIGLVCHEPNPEDILRKDVPFDSGDVFRGDCVEIMLDPGRSRNDYYHFGVNVSGARYDRSVTQSGHVGDHRWDGRWRARTFVGKDFWSCEVAIPFFTLGLSPGTGSTWGINLCREKKRPVAENSSTAEQGAFHVAGRFAQVVGIDADLRRYCYRVDPPATATAVEGGKLHLSVKAQVTNETGSDRRALVECILIAAERQPVARSAAIELKAGVAQTQQFDAFVLDTQGDAEYHLRVADSETKETLALRSGTLTVEYVPMSIKLVEPWYRDCIFETQKLERIIADVDVRLGEDRLADSELRALIRKQGDAAEIAARTVARPTSTTRVEFSNADLPYGKLELVAQLRDRAGEVIEETSQPLRKLPYRKGEVWLGRDLVWRVEGEPFFINGCWGRDKDRNPYFNTYTTHVEGVKHVWCLHVPTNLRLEFRNDTLSGGFRQYIREKVAEAAQDPELLTLFLWDEPECSAFSAKGLAEAYRIFREVDPYHPVIICNDSLTGLREYADAAEINGFHPYPPILKDKPINDLTEHVVCMDIWKRLYREGKLKQTIAFLHQGFNYGDYGAVNQRVPNYPELRRQNLLNIILGATGILQFNRSVAHYPELHIGIPHLTRELAYLGKAVVAPTSALAVSCDHPKARSLLKEVDGDLFLFVCNADMAPRDLRVSVPGLGKRAKRLRVISEDRTVSLEGDTLVDSFGTFGVHVYSTSTVDTGLPTVRAIEAEIAAANHARRKPGNLVFQEFEGDGVVLQASSNTSGKFRRPDNALWHVVDGVVATFDHYKSLMWYDATPNEYPDWLEIRMPEAQTVGRVVVYPFEKSLKDYAVQLFVDGGWRDVAKVSGQSADEITHRFDPVSTDRIRLWVTATNTPLSQVNEVEVYRE